MSASAPPGRLRLGPQKQAGANALALQPVGAFGIVTATLGLANTVIHRFSSELSSIKSEHAATVL
jgi:hypothetical protein